MIKILIILVLAEAIIRIFKLAPKIPKGHNIYQQSEVLSYGLKPNITQTIEISTGDGSFTVSHNSMGLRDTEHGDKKRVRILALGDSYAYGWGCEYEDTFLYQLERWLDVEVVKAGIPGYEMEDCRKFLELYNDFYKPDIVLLCVAPNDALCLGGKHSVTKNGYLIWDTISFKLSWVLFRHSHLARAIIKFLARQRFPLEINTDKITKEIAAMRKMASKLIVLSLPDPVNPKVDLRDFCRAWEIPYIDTYFHESDNFLKDGHCNSNGNYLIAKLAYTRLLKEVSCLR